MQKYLLQTGGMVSDDVQVDSPSVRVPGRQYSDREAKYAYLGECQFQIIHEVEKLSIGAIVGAEGARAGGKTTREYVEVSDVDARVIGAKEGTIGHGDRQQHLALHVGHVAAGELRPLDEVDPTVVRVAFDLIDATRR